MAKKTNTASSTNRLGDENGERSMLVVKLLDKCVCWYNDDDHDSSDGGGDDDDNKTTSGFGARFNPPDPQHGHSRLGRGKNDSV